MYTYIVERTQIYLSAKQTEELDKRARDQGTTRSHLIREAVEKYLAPDWDAEAFKAALNGIAGMWADRDDLDDLRESMRAADRARMERLYPDFGSEARDPDDPR
jgi:metal-responsive CopG/Arc/MetJ family transcriptional regulator